jgi:hypothetical protein
VERVSQQPPHAHAIQPLRDLLVSFRKARSPAVRARRLARLLAVLCLLNERELRWVQRDVRDLPQWLRLMEC